MEEHLVSPADAWTHLLASLKLLPGFDDIQVTITDETIHILCRDPVQREAIKKHIDTSFEA